MVHFTGQACVVATNQRDPPFLMSICASHLLFAAMAAVVVLPSFVSSLPNWLSFCSMCMLVCPRVPSTHRISDCKFEHV